GSNERRIHEAKDGDSGGNAQGQHEDRRAGEAGILQKLTKSESEILHPMIDHVQATHIATRLHVLRHRSHASTCCDTRVVVRNASGSSLFDFAFEVILQLLVELALDIGFEEERAKAKSERGHPARHSVPLEVTLC